MEALGARNTTAGPAPAASSLAPSSVAQWLRATEAAALRLGLTLHPVPFLGQDPGHWEQVFESVARRRIGAATIHEAPVGYRHSRTGIPGRGRRVSPPTAG